MENERKRVRDRSVYIDLSSVFDDCTLEQAMARLSEYKSIINESKNETARFRVEYGYEMTDVYMDIYRDETDQEFKKRLAKEAEAKEKARKIAEAKKEKARKQLFKEEEDERKEYERLKKKFEDK